MQLQYKYLKVFLVEEPIYQLEGQLFFEVEIRFNLMLLSGERDTR